MGIGSALARARQVCAGKTATIYRDRQRSWREVYDRVARMAGALKSLGVGPGDRVVGLALNNDRYFELLL